MCEEREARKCHTCGEAQVTLYKELLRERIEEFAKERVEQDDWQGQSALIDLIDILELPKLKNDLPIE